VPHLAGADSLPSRSIRHRPRSSAGAFDASAVAYVLRDAIASTASGTVPWSTGSRATTCIGDPPSVSSERLRLFAFKKFSTFFLREALRGSTPCSWIAFACGPSVVDWLRTIPCHGRVPYSMRARPRARGDADAPGRD